MVLELHVWGPAFSLPSIDAQCLAAIAYLQQAVPRGDWKLIASSNPALSPTSTLPPSSHYVPILIVSQTSFPPFVTVTSGLGDSAISFIISHSILQAIGYSTQVCQSRKVLTALRKLIRCVDVAQNLTSSCSFSSFLESHGQPLLDLSLYVSSENYATITRPIYNTIQSFPLPYLTPGAIRAAAKKRTEHLGLSGLDVDTEDGGAHEKSIIPESLRHPRNTVSSLLAASPEVNAQIRLNALATTFFEPLQQLRGEKRYFLSNGQFSSLDCLILGYLSLMLVPDLPQPWLVKTLRNKFPTLCDWTETSITSIFGPATTLTDAFPAYLGDSVKDIRAKSPRAESFLPWKAPNTGGVVGVTGTFLATVVDSIPVVGQFRRNTTMRQHGGKTSEEEQSSYWQTLTAVGGLIASVGIMIGYAFHTGLISVSPVEDKREEKSAGLGAFGEAGAALGLYAQQLNTPLKQDTIHDNITTEGVSVVEVDVEVP